MPEKFSIDREAVRELAELLVSSGLNEIEYHQGEAWVRVAKSPPPPAPTPSAPLNAPVFVETAAAPPPSEVSAPKDAVKSPMVGTVYVAPEPGASPFVRVGDQIEEGQTLFIVEAMKVMNPIRAPRAGRVSDICITDASPVEYGEALMYLE